MGPIGDSVTGNFTNTSKGNVILTIKDSKGSTVYSSPEENSGFFAFRATDSGDYKFYVDNLENDPTTVDITVNTATSDGVALAALVMGLSCIAIGYFTRHQLRKPKDATDS